MFQKYLSLLKDAAKHVARRWKTILLFEIVFHVYSSVIVFPLSRYLYNACIRFTGINLLSADTVKTFFTNPLMLGCCLVILLLFTLNFMLELSCILTMMHSDQTLSIRQILREGTFDMFRLLRPRNWLMLLLILFILPFTQLHIAKSLMGVVHITGQRLLAYLEQVPYIYIAVGYAIAVFLICMFLLCWLHIYVLEDRPTGSALKEAFRLTRGHRFTSMLFVLASIVLVTMLTSLAVALIRRGAAFLMTCFSGNATLNYNLMLALTTVLSFLNSAVPTIFAYAMITSVYDSAKTASGQPIPQRNLPVRPNAARHNTIAFYLVAGVCVVSLVLYDAWLRPLMVRFNVLDYVESDSTYIAAHRGDASTYDENTLSALQSAVAQGADYIEFDVQTTSDGVVIVNHDNDYNRVFGRNAKVWETSFDDVMTFGGRKTGERPPTLKEVLTQCPANANFLVELKDNGHNPKLAKQVYDVIMECGCLDRCRIQSASYKLLRDFKQLAPEANCGYILSISLGNYTTLKSADFFSVDESFVTDEVVESVHSAGKEIFCWTVDTEQDMREMLSIGVDGIITDNVPLLRSMIVSTEVSPIEEIIPESIEEITDSIGDILLEDGSATKAPEQTEEPDVNQTAF